MSDGLNRAKDGVTSGKEALLTAKIQLLERKAEEEVSERKSLKAALAIAVERLKISAEVGCGMSADALHEIDSVMRSHEDDEGDEKDDSLSPDVMLKCHRRRYQETVAAAHDYLRAALGLSQKAPYRFDFYAEKIGELLKESDLLRQNVELMRQRIEMHDAEQVEIRSDFDAYRIDEPLRFARMRGLGGPEEFCPACSGAGVRRYPSSATWRQEVGDEIVTIDVCDQCWGSGSFHRPGVNLRRIHEECASHYAVGRADAIRDVAIALEVVTRVGSLEAVSAFVEDGLGAGSLGPLQGEG